MQTGSSETLIGWKSGKTTYVYGTEWRERGHGRVVKTGFCQRGLGQTNEQQRLINE
jgi:hypothetical protein